MAVYKYKVQKNDTFASLGDAKKIMQLNPGVPKLSPGRVIKLPSNPNPGGTMTNNKAASSFIPNKFNRTAPTVGTGSFLSGNGTNALGFTPSIKLPTVTQPPPANSTAYANGLPSLLSNNMAPSAPAHRPTGSGVVGVAPQPPTSTQQPQPAATGGTAARPSGTYDPNAANAKEWRKYWNQSAGGSGDEQVHTMSKGDVWDMKARQRRKTGGRGAPKKVAVVSPLPPADIAPTGNAVNTSLNWRAG